jgi:hypothetical protein
MGLNLVRYFESLDLAVGRQVPPLFVFAFAFYDIAVGLFSFMF